MQVHNLSKSGNKKAKRIGRGGKRGSFSGKMHKRRGYGRNRAQSVNANKAKIAVVNLREIDKKFSALGGSAFGGKDIIRITPQMLVEVGLVKKVRGDKMPKIKILGDGKLTKKLVFDKNFLMSKSDKEKIG